ncbi:hypothetical protein B0H14DRAFT_3701445 [Mycena olivaceomarginata]|nr:hypothetical protein B0H14DRAFT_3701445 [Mycena olivaceomarginata]
MRLSKLPPFSFHLAFNPVRAQDFLVRASTAARYDCYPDNKAGYQTLGLNTGISLSAADTSLIIAFGDSWTANGSPDGSKANAPIYNPTDGLLIENGTFRITNGYTWIEWVSMYGNIPLRDYAVPGALTDRSMYPGKEQSSDFIQQADLFLSQNIQIDADRTVFSIYFGINDWANGGDLRTRAIPRLLAQVKRKLVAPPVSARKFLFVGLPQWSDLENNNFVEQIYEFRDQVAAEGISIDFAYVNLVRLYAHVKANLASYGFTERGPCVTRAGGTSGAYTQLIGLSSRKYAADDASSQHLCQPRPPHDISIHPPEWKGLNKGSLLG